MIENIKHFQNVPIVVDCDDSSQVFNILYAPEYFKPSDTCIVFL